eukprot:gene2339-3066_t
MECTCITNSERVFVTVSKYCLCKSGYFLVMEDGAKSGRCQVCSDGGTCPGDNLMYAEEDYWRDTLEQRKFYSCRKELCLYQTETDVGLSKADDPVANAAATLDIDGSKCKEGHTGPVCAVCNEGWAYQGEFCLECSKSSQAKNWPAWQWVLLVILYIIVHSVLHVVLLWWPLLHSGVHKRVRKAYSYAERRMSILQDGINRHRMSLTDNPLNQFEPDENVTIPVNEKSAQNPISHRTAEEEMEEEEEDPVDIMQDLHDRFEGMLASFRTIINFLQIVTSFTRTMDIPWPTIFYSFSANLAIVRLNMVQLPVMACTSPEPSFYSILAGYVGAFSLFCAYIVLVGVFGSWTKSTHTRLDKFKNTCLNRLVFIMYLAYPSLSATIMATFACQQLYDDWYLRADYRIKCYDTEYTLYAVFATACTGVFVFGIPAFFYRLLTMHSVPELAKVKYDNACLYELIWHAIRQKVLTPGVVDHETSTQKVPDAVIDRLWDHYCSSSSDKEIVEAKINRETKLIDLLQYVIIEAKIKVPEMKWGESGRFDDPTDPTFEEREKLAITRVGFLIDMYHVNAWHWELVEMLRKFLLTSVIVFVDPGTATQVTTAFIICVIMYNAYYAYHPFKLEEVDNVSQVAMADMAVLVFIGLLLK